MKGCYVMDRTKGIISGVLVATLLVNTTIVANAEEAATDNEKGFGAVTLLSAENAQVTNPSKSEKLKGSIVLGEKADNQEHEVKFLLGTYNEGEDLHVLKQDDKELTKTEKVKFEEDGQIVDTMFDFDSTPYKDKKIVLQIEVDGEIVENNELTSQVRITNPKIEADQVLEDGKLTTKVTYEDFAPQEVADIHVVQMDKSDESTMYKLNGEYVIGDDRVVPKQARTDQTVTSAVEGSKEVVATLSNETPNELYTVESIDKEVDEGEAASLIEAKDADGEVPVAEEKIDLTDEELVTPFVTVVSDNTVIAEVKIEKVNGGTDTDTDGESNEQNTGEGTDDSKDDELDISKDDLIGSDIVKPEIEKEQPEQLEADKVIEIEKPEKLVQTGASSSFTFNKIYNWLYNL